MAFITAIGEAFIYLCFALLFGSFILKLTPLSSRPDIIVPKWAMIAAATGIGVFSFIPVSNLILFLYKDVGLWLTVQSVLTQFEVGKAWVITASLSLLLVSYLVIPDINKRTFFPLPGLLMTLSLAAALGWASHASSIVGFKGFFVHTIHFTSVTIWIGILLIAGWFSTSFKNWQQFLKWFTPLAVLLFIISIGTGLLLMSVSLKIDDYTNAWALSYGQALLIKHLFIIPLLATAFINGFFIKEKLAISPSFDPRPWAKVESLIALCTFSVTGALSQQAPPHDLKITIQSEGVSPLYSLLTAGHFPNTLSLTFSALVFLLFAIASLAGIFLSFRKYKSRNLTLLCSFCFVFSAYLALMFSVA